MSEDLLYIVEAANRVIDEYPDNSKELAELEKILCEFGFRSWNEE